jgi:hypothetical protein
MISSNTVICNFDLMYYRIKKSFKILQVYMRNPQVCNDSKKTHSIIKKVLKDLGIHFAMTDSSSSMDV